MLPHAAHDSNTPPVTVQHADGVSGGDCEAVGDGVGAPDADIVGDTEEVGVTVGDGVLLALTVDVALKAVDTKHDASSELATSLTQVDGKVFVSPIEPCVSATCALGCDKKHPKGRLERRFR